jgi:glutathione S-transferase
MLMVSALNEAVTALRGYSMPTLLHLTYSPWSEKARWALDHHRIAYDRESYVPMLGEPMLRVRVRRLRGKVTVPVLFDGGAPLMDSFAIARWADRRGSGATLFPAGRDAEIERWNALGERLLAAGRAGSVERTLHDREALHEALPPGLRRLGPAGAALAGVGARYILHKYRGAEDRSTMREVMGELRDALRGGPHLLGALSYADIAMAVSLQLVSPVSDEFLRIGPGYRRVCTDPELAGEFADVLSWRDAIYAKHRR